VQQVLATAAKSVSLEEECLDEISRGIQVSSWRDILLLSLKRVESLDFDTTSLAYVDIFYSQILIKPQFLRNEVWPDPLQSGSHFYNDAPPQITNCWPVIAAADGDSK